ncbi:hypothetical protein THRCLA_00948 [Thraustotheca clavata]|uniref:Ubiquitin-like domain-containing protein n=1 Tax=Thraustotheca clavata TaxID=74557 RepID=A0A1W0A9R4_9STRA|nr:hypothetical protein THRCLA_00948 [Thraustotheca clavata]
MEREEWELVVKQDKKEEQEMNEQEEEIPIRVRVGEQLYAHAFTKNDSVQEFVDRVFPMLKEDGKRVRMIYKGGLLEFTKLMMQYNFEPDDVIHAIITDIVPETTQSSTSSPSNEMLFGMPLRAADALLLFTGIILLALWFVYGNYPQSFNAVSFLMLLSLSGFHAYCVYCAFILSNLGR